MSKSYTSRFEHKPADSIRESLLLILVLAITSLMPRPALAVGLLPVPVFESADVQVGVVRDESNPFVEYVYTYTIGNPATNTGEIWYFKVDISDSEESFDPPADPTLPRGTANVNFFVYRDSIQPLLLLPGQSVVPIGQKVPSGWLGGFGRDGFLGFASGTGTPKILPGESLSGFQIISRRVPALRRVNVIPDWVHLVESEGDATEEDRDQAVQVEENLRFTTTTLGPSTVIGQGSFEHWNKLNDDVNRMVNELQWIVPTLGGTLLAQLADARAALDADDGTLAKQRLQTLLNTLAQATIPDQLLVEARGLIQLNVESLIANTADTPIPFEPKVIATPKVAELPIGTEYTLTAKVINVANNDEPVEGFLLEFIIDEGPHKEFEGGDQVVTDANGEAAFTFVGTMVGTDKIRVEEVLESPRAFAEVTWTGGPDLVVPLFIPPFIQTEAGNTVFISDITTNQGVIASPPSVTRYFLSAVEPVNPATAELIGERQVGALEPNESSEQFELAFTIPSGFPPGTYFMAACADANASIVELDEENNCSFNELQTITSLIVPGLESDNNPPDCSQAAASPGSLWPPNHKLVDIDITGVTDPEGSPVSLTITSIEQDEPVNGAADGNTSPDGFGVGTAKAQVRRERSGQGNGRIYEIGFDAQDGQGGSCTGSVLVGVPHDQGQGSTPIDDGVRFDSTQP